MPAPLAVDKEQVHMLVMTHGPREAARMCNLSENTVLQWSKRGKWLAFTRAAPTPAPKSMQATPVIGVISPVAALANTLAEDDKATRSDLSAALRAGAKHAASLSGVDVLGSARNVHELTKAASGIHGWDASRPDVRINIFTDQTKIADAIEIESSVERIE